jgi:hypothetical protein
MMITRLLNNFPAFMLCLLLTAAAWVFGVPAVRLAWQHFCGMPWPGVKP